LRKGGDTPRRQEHAQDSQATEMMLKELRCLPSATRLDGSNNGDRMKAMQQGL